MYLNAALQQASFLKIEHELAALLKCCKIGHRLLEGKFTELHKLSALAVKPTFFRKTCFSNPQNAEPTKRYGAKILICLSGQ